MLKLFLGFLFVLLSQASYSQLAEFKDNYQPLTSSGNLPEIYTKSATEKANKDIEILANTKGVKNRSDKKNFYLLANFYQDRLLRSGRLLFNDPISKFVNKVADVTFKSDPDLRSKLQIFIVKSPVVNAYCFDNGIILVNTGLIAQLDNEAQLSYVLSHEASHFVRKHSIVTYVEKKSGSGKYSRKSEMDNYKYSQENELEADVQGLKYFKDTKYSYTGITGCFNVLKYSYLPFDEIPFKKNFFEDSNLVFPSSYFLSEVTPIKKNEDEDDSRSTHPNIKKRKEMASEALGEISDDDRLKFIVDQFEFYRVREMARFEQCRIELINRNYATCVYNCYLLTQKYPDNMYLKTTIGKALFGLAAAKAPKRDGYHKKFKIDVLDDDDDNENYHINYEKREGNSQQLFYFLEKLSPLQSSVLALNYNWKLREQSKGNNALINRLNDSLFIFLTIQNDVDRDYFYKTTRSEFISTWKSNNRLESDTTKKPDKPVVKRKKSLAELDESEKDSKVARIEKMPLPVDPKLAQARLDSLLIAELDNNYQKFAFADFLNKGSVFSDKLNKAHNVESNLAKTNTGNELKNQGGMGVDKIVILDPFYIKMNFRHEVQVRYLESDNKLEKFGTILKENAAAVKLEYDYLDSRTLEKQEIERYNDYTVFRDWVSEYLNHNFNPNTLVLNNEAATRIKEKYKTRYLLWSGIYNAKLKKQSIGAAVLGTLFLYPAPITLNYLLRREEKTFYIAVLFDLEENKVQFYETVSLRIPDSRDFLNAFVYDTMLSIKQKSKFK